MIRSLTWIATLALAACGGSAKHAETRPMAPVEQPAATESTPAADPPPTPEPVAPEATTPLIGGSGPAQKADKQAKPPAKPMKATPPKQPAPKSADPCEGGE